MSNKSNKDELDKLWSEGLSNQQANELIGFVNRAGRMEYESPVRTFTPIKVSFAFATLATLCIAIFTVIPMSKTRDVSVFSPPSKQVLSETDLEGVLGDFAFFDENDLSTLDSLWIEDLIETL